MSICNLLFYSFRVSTVSIFYDSFFNFRSILISGHTMTLLFEVSTLKNWWNWTSEKHKGKISYLFPKTIMEISAKTKNATTAYILQSIRHISDLIGKTLSQTNQYISARMIRLGTLPFNRNSCSFSEIIFLTCLYLLCSLA